MYRIMLVDDEPNILSALRRALAKLGPGELDGEAPIIEPYASAAEALKRAGEARFDLVISDFRMPDMNGVEFLKQMVDLQPNVARIVLSGYTELESVIEAVNEVQILRYMTKPWNDAELRLVVRQGLSQRAMFLENERLADLVRKQQAEILRQRRRLALLEDDELDPSIESVTLDDELDADPDGAEVIDYPDETGIEIDESIDLDDKR
jgi:YesN/AraC family two-component response regulator